MQGYGFLEGLDNIFGYRTDKGGWTPELKAKAIQWITGFEENKLRDALKPSYIPWKMKKCNYRKEWYLQPWIFYTSGGMPGKGNKYTVKHHYKYRVTKTDWFLDVTTDQIMHIINEGKPAGTAAIKIEGGKQRVFEFLNEYMSTIGAIIMSAVYNTAQDSDNMWAMRTRSSKRQRMLRFSLRIKEIRQQKLSRILCPLDQSDYDMHITPQIRENHHLLLKQKVLEMHVDEDTKSFLNMIFDKFIYALRSYPVDVDGVKYNRINGEPSGLYTTNLDDSWIHHTVTLAALKKWHPTEIENMGDDISCELDATATIEEISEEYAKYGFVVSKVKNYISQESTEFLRTLYTERGFGGYVIRSLNGLLYDNQASGKGDADLGYDNISASARQYQSRLAFTGWSYDNCSYLFSASRFKDVRYFGVKKYFNIDADNIEIIQKRTEDYTETVKSGKMFQICKSIGMSADDFQEYFKKMTRSRSALQLTKDKSQVLKIKQLEERMANLPLLHKFDLDIQGFERSTGLYGIDKWITDANTIEQATHRVKRWNTYAEKVGQKQMVIWEPSIWVLKLSFGILKMHFHSTGIHELFDAMVKDNLKNLVMKYFANYTGKIGKVYLDAVCERIQRVNQERVFSFLREILSNDLHIYC